MVRPHTRTPTARAATHEPFHRSVTRLLFSVTPLGSRPRDSAPEQPLSSRTLDERDPGQTGIAAPVRRACAHGWHLPWRRSGNGRNPTPDPVRRPGRVRPRPRPARRAVRASAAAPARDAPVALLRRTSDGPPVARAASTDPPWGTCAQPIDGRDAPAGRPDRSTARARGPSSLAARSTTTRRWSPPTRAANSSPPEAGDVRRQRSRAGPQSESATALSTEVAAAHGRRRRSSASARRHPG